MKLGVVTLAGSGYGLNVLNALRQEKYPAHTIVVLSDTFTRKWRLLRRVARQIGWANAVQYALEWQWRGLTMRGAKGLSIQGHQQLGAQVFVTTSLRSLSLERALGDSGVEWALLLQAATPLVARCGGSFARVPGRRRAAPSTLRALSA